MLKNLVLDSDPILFGLGLSERKEVHHNSFCVFPLIIACEVVLVFIVITESSMLINQLVFPPVVYT